MFSVNVLAVFVGPILCVVFTLPCSVVCDVICVLVNFVFIIT